MTPKQKHDIDAMTQEEMAYHWRFAPIGDPLMYGEAGDYFKKVFDSKGGMTPEISKKIGWGR